MKRFLRLTVFIAAVALLASGACRRASAESDGVIRVKLSQLGAPQIISMIANCDYLVNGLSDMTISAGTAFSVVNALGALRLQRGEMSLDMGASLMLKRTGGGVSGMKFTSPALQNVFTGDLTFSITSGGIVVILNIELEHYLYGVVGNEMSPSNPAEALKAQAVAARTYALRQKSTRTASGYDVTDSASNQVFRGYNSSHTAVIAAVDLTAGQTLKYGDGYAACYYSSSNGGQTESTKNAWGTALDYSVVKDDPYDLESGATSKSATIYKDARGIPAELSAYLKAGMIPTLDRYKLSSAPEDIIITGIASITPLSPRYPAPSKVYKLLRFTVNASTLDAAGARIPGYAVIDVPTFDGVEDWFSLSINSSDNETVWISESADAFTVTFRRYGHGVGMSQRGARAMARDYGMNYAQILEFYYPGTRLDGGNPVVIAPDAPIGKAYVKLASSASALNLRAGASTSSAIIGSLKNGAELDVYAVSGEWAAVAYSGRRGFVAARYIARQTQAPAPEIEATSEYARVALSSAASRLNLRAAPSLTAAVITSLPHGKYVKILSSEGDWARVETEAGQTGYVSARYIALTEQPTGEYVAYLKLASASGRMNLRAGAGTHTSILATLQSGMYLNVIGASGEWSNVRTLSGVSGYVMTQYLTRDIAPDFVVHNAGGIMYSAVSTEAAFMRVSPGADADAIEIVNSGAELAIYAHNDKWAFARYGDSRGYIELDCLRKAD